MNGKTQLLASLMICFVVATQCYVLRKQQVCVSNLDCPEGTLCDKTQKPSLEDRLQGLMEAAAFRAEEEESPLNGGYRLFGRYRFRRNELPQKRMAGIYRGGKNEQKQIVTGICKANGEE